ncbi:hypothetical protein E2562_034364 [Oryza meyeriana var. granulata]|uniref:Uncharacterized protein n=1 Tax=Oryza meyeriana var. granulata TaxID=110450 RepID=A0A6G1FFF0_9ORYZ|nr:hypothetical protein E2562_034364 [Oryza meyeriana var. granulata]
MLATAREVVDWLRVVAATEGAELNEKRFALAEEREHLEEGCQVLETLVRMAKVVYNRTMVEIEREQAALAVEREEAIAKREQAEEEADELKCQ